MTLIGFDPLLLQSVAELQEVVALKQQLSFEAFRARNAEVYNAIKDQWQTIAKERQMEASGTERKVSGTSVAKSKTPEI